MRVIEISYNLSWHSCSGKIGAAGSGVIALPVAAIAYFKEHPVRDFVLQSFANQLNDRFARQLRVRVCSLH
jgi:hypothetical protein